MKLSRDRAVVIMEELRSLGAAAGALGHGDKHRDLEEIGDDYPRLNLFIGDNWHDTVRYSSRAGDFSRPIENIPWHLSNREVAEYIVRQCPQALTEGL